MLPPRQKEVLDFIVSFMRANDGVSPTPPEIGDSIGNTNKTPTFYILKQLELRGYIRRLHRKVRAIEVLRESPAKPIPIYDAATPQIRGYVS